MAQSEHQPAPVRDDVVLLEASRSARADGDVGVAVNLTNYARDFHDIEPCDDLLIRVYPNGVWITTHPNDGD